MRRDCSLCRKRRPYRADRMRSSAFSPACPNGGWPTSWPRPIASVRSSLSRSARATTREIAVVSSVCVMRVRVWSPAGSMKTCVLPLSRRNDFEWVIRSRSRWNGVRTPHSSSWASRPRVSYEATASGERASRSCSRTVSANRSATEPRRSGTRSSVTGAGDCSPGGVRLRDRYPHRVRKLASCVLGATLALLALTACGSDGVGRRGTVRVRRLTAARHRRSRRRRPGLSTRRPRRLVPLRRRSRGGVSRRAARKRPVAGRRLRARRRQQPPLDARAGDLARGARRDHTRDQRPLGLGGHP